MIDDEKLVKFNYETTSDGFLITGEWTLVPKEDQSEQLDTSQNQSHFICFHPSSNIKIDDYKISLKFYLCDSKENIEAPVLIFVDVVVESNDDKLIMPFTMHFELLNEEGSICRTKHQVEYNFHGKRAAIIFPKNYKDAFKTATKYVIRFSIRHTKFTPKFEPISWDELLVIPDPGPVVLIEPKVDTK